MPLGIGGGSLMVPFMRIFGYDIRKSIGTAAAVGFLIAVSGTVTMITSGKIINNINALGINTFIECGPGKVLSGLVKRIVNNVEIMSLDDYSTFKEIFDKHK